MVSVGVGGKDVGGVTLPILKVGRPFEVKREFRTVSKVPGSSQFKTATLLKIKAGAPARLVDLGSDGRS